MFKHPLLYVGIVLVGMFVAGGLIRPASEGPYVDQARTKAESAKSSDSGAGIAPAPARQQGETQAKVYSANCDRPEDHNQADLCVQRRMAQAAEHQNWINSWALAALVATLIATFVAAGAAVIAVRAAHASTILDHPPRFKITRPILYIGDAYSRLPEFAPGESINGMAFAMNYGRSIAKIDKTRCGTRWNADCYVFWARGNIIPMHEAYERAGSTDLWPVLEHPTDVSLPDVAGGRYVVWKFITAVPEDFTISADGEWSHIPHIIGHIRYAGPLDDKRGFFFCKRYVSRDCRFEDVKEHENED